MADSGGIQRQLSNFNSLSEFLELQNPSISDLIESITYNPQSQNVIIQFRDLLRTESDRIHRGTVLSDQDAEKALERLSERYKKSFPQFLECYNQWKPKRRKLIRTSNASADQIDLNSSMLSAFRIITSTADIIGTLQLFREHMSSWSLFAFENASIVGIMGLFLEKQQSSQYYSEVQKLIREDQRMFEELIKWFKQAEELDRAVKTFFPYGIDKDVVRMIDKVPSMTDEYYKLFAAIVVSNVKNDVNLFKNRHFLDKAENFATSEAGRQWFHKVIIEDDPLVSDCIKIDLTAEISRIMIASKQNADTLVESSALFATKAVFKLLLSGITIYSSVRNLWNDTKKEDSEALRELAAKAERELNAIKRVLELLRPVEVDIGDALE